MRTIVIAAFLAVAFPVASEAQVRASIASPVEGYSYFNRPGATVEQHRAAIEACAGPAFGMVEPSGGAYYNPVVMQYGLAGAVVGSLVAAEMQAQQVEVMQQRALRANYENCMVAHGWRVVQLSARRGQALERLDQPELALQLRPMIGAEQPEGTIVKSFGNDAVHLRAAMTPTSGASTPVSLSMLALPGDSIAAQRHHSQRLPSIARSRAELDARHAQQAEDRDREQRLNEALRNARANPGQAPASRIADVQDTTTLTSDLTLVVVRVIGARNGGAVTFTRVEDNPDPNEQKFFVASLPIPDRRNHDTSVEKTLVFAIPPGQWRIEGMSNGYASVGFCMGAPTFDVAAGDVVFAGTFDLSGDALVPDLTLTPAETALASHTDLASRLRAASYLNGSTARCTAAAFLYAYEIPGARFREGYRAGSQANLTAPADQTPAQTAPAQAAPH